MLNASGPQAGQHGDSRAVISLVGWTQSFARTRMRPERIGTMASGELGVKLSISSTSAAFPYHPRQRIGIFVGREHVPRFFPLLS